MEKQRNFHNTQQQKHPNIIWIITHDTGTHFSCYDGHVPTPNIDQIAQKGVKFINHFACAPQCTPSRGGILTGKSPHFNGLMGLTNLGWNLPTQKNLTMPAFFKDQGYSTHLIGLQHSHAEAKKLGYKFISSRRDFPYYSTTIRRRVKKFIKKNRTR